MAGEEAIVDLGVVGGVDEAVDLVAAAEAGENSDRGLGLGEHGLLAGYPGVAGGGELEAAAEDTTDEGRDRRLALAELVQRRLPAVDQGEGRVMVAEDRDEAAKIRTVAELAAVDAVRREDDRLDAVVCGELLVGCVELGDEGVVDRRPLERDHPDPVVNADTDVDLAPSSLAGRGVEGGGRGDGLGLGDRLLL